MNIVNIITISIILFAVIDMLGSIPLIIKMRETYGEIESFKASVIAVVIMVTTLFFGKHIFHAMGIETHHFALAGAFLIVYFGIKMVLGIESDSSDSAPDMKATVFPIAFPLIAGPGTLATLISLRSKFEDIDIVAGILINAIVIFIVLKSATWIKTKLGNVGIILMERVFGIILIAMGMKMLIYNLIASINEVLL